MHHTGVNPDYKSRMNSMPTMKWWWPLEPCPGRSTLRCMIAERATRLAPSPTGALHLGNARTFLINWVLARQRGWRIHLRIDDLEGPRIKPGADLQAIEDLHWLGIDWSEPPIRQSGQTADYQQALDVLLARGFVYPCVCTRTEIAAAAGGRLEPDQADFYPGTCRGRYSSMEEALRLSGRTPSLRFRVPAAEIEFCDALLGEQRIMGQSEIGDFIVRKADGEFGYHLANVVDDARLGMTDIVRGQDLLASAPRQILIYRALGLEDRIPQYIHLPLVTGPDGRKLAKRHGDTRLRALREQGVSSAAVRHMLARWSGWTPASSDASLAEWVERLELARIPLAPIVYDDARDRPRPDPVRGAP